MHILDCGCGAGSITMGFAQKVHPAKVVGIDQDGAQIAQANARAQELGLNNVTFLVANVHQIPFEDSRFDGVFSHALLEHLTDPLGALSEMRRVLKDGGIIGARVPDHGGYLLNPSDNKILANSLKLQERLLQYKGGDPFIGRKLRGLLHAAKFIKVHVGASWDYAGTEDQVAFVSSLLSSSFTDGGLVRQLLDLGWSTYESLQEMAAEWLKWKNDPSAILGIARCEGIGYK